MMFLDAILGEVPRQGFPCVADPLTALKDRKIRVTIERDTDSKMTEEEFMKGFNMMDAKARRHWLSDIQTMKFRVKGIDTQPPTASTMVDANTASASSVEATTAAASSVNANAAANELGASSTI